MSRVPSTTMRCSVRAAAASPAVAGFRPTAAALAIAAAFSLQAPAVQAQPSGAQVVHGQASFATIGNRFVVTTRNGAGTSHSAINWQSFSVPVGSITQFVQPSVRSTSINRVLGPDPSAIYGTLSSNGRLVLVNPSGIAVGPGAVVDTAGFTASTLGMTEADALAGRMRFAGGTGPLAVDGTVLARSGDVVLIGSQVQAGRNALVRSEGTTLLAAGEKVELTGRGLEGIRLEVQAGHEAVNLGTLQGDAVGIFAGTLKHSGVVQAQAVSTEGGKVVLKAEGDNLVSGTVATSAGQRGGAIDVLGERVGLLAGAKLQASGTAGGGQVRVGGDYQGRNAAVPNAKAVYVDAQARIEADATQRGDGGRVIVWSDEMTRMRGQISARGGARGGDGGFAEVSGRQYLEYRGFADLRAPQGTLGSLLLDPENFRIIHSTSGPPYSETVNTFPVSTSSPPGAMFAPSATGDVTLTDAHLNAQLGGGNVLVTTSSDTSTGTGGQITVNADATVQWNNASHLSLQADKGIDLLGAIRSTGVGSAVHLLAKDGSIADGGTGVIQAPALFAYAINPGTTAGAGKIVLNGANQVDVLAARVDGPGAEVRFHNNQMLTIGAVSTEYGGGSGIAGWDGAHPAIIDISSEGKLVVDAAGPVTGGSVSLRANGSGSDLVVMGDVTALAGMDLRAGRDLRIDAQQVYAAGTLSMKARDVRIATADMDANTSVYGDGAICIDAGRNIVIGTRVGTVGTPYVDVNAAGALILKAGTGNMSFGSAGTSGGYYSYVTLSGRGVSIDAPAGSVNFDGQATVASSGGPINVSAGQDITGNGNFYNYGTADATGADGAVNLGAGGAITFNSIQTSGTTYEETGDSYHAGQVNLQAGGDVQGTYIDASGGTYGSFGGNAGAVNVTSDGGSIAIWAIQAIGGGEGYSTGSPGGGMAGQVSVHAKGLGSGPGDILLGYVNVSGASGDAPTAGGKVHIQADNGNVGVQQVVARGGGNMGSTGGAGAAGGQISVVASGDLTIHAGEGTSLSADGGDSDSGAGGAGGEVHLGFGGDLVVPPVGESTFYQASISASGGVGGVDVAGNGATGGSGGLITLTRNGGDLRLDPAIALLATGGWGRGANPELGGTTGGTGGAGGQVELMASGGRVVLASPVIDASGGGGGSNADDVTSAPAGALGGLKAMGTSVDVEGPMDLHANWTNDSIVNIGEGSSVTGPGSFLNNSELRLADGGLLLPDGGVVNAGLLTSTSGDVTAGLTQNTGTVDVQAGSTLNAPLFFSNEGSVQANGTLAVGTCSGCEALFSTASANTFTNQAAGVLTGNGTISVDAGAGTVSNFGTLAPGGTGSIGTLSLGASLLMQAGSTYAADILDAGSHDSLVVSGDTTTGGAFAVNYLPGANFSTGQRLRMLQSATVDASTMPTVDKPELQAEATGTELLLRAAAPFPPPPPPPAPPPAPGPTPAQQAAVQQLGSQVVNFAQLFVQMSDQQEAERIGKDDIVITDTACKP